MTTGVTRTLLAATAAGALLLAGCGGSKESSSSSSAAPSGSSSAAEAPKMTNQQAPPDRVTLDVTIKGGQVSPTNKALEAKVGEPIVVRVNSDAPDELHVHSVPDHEFEIEPKDGQTFQFTVDVPGKVDMELHKADKTVASIVVR